MKGVWRLDHDVGRRGAGEDRAVTVPRDAVQSELLTRGRTVYFPQSPEDTTSANLEKHPSVKYCGAG